MNSWHSIGDSALFAFVSLQIGFERVNVSHNFVNRHRFTPQCQTPFPFGKRHSYIPARADTRLGVQAAGFLQSRFSRIFLDKESLFDFTDRTARVAQSVQIARILPVSEWKNPRNLDRLRYLCYAIYEIEQEFRDE